MSLKPSGEMYLESIYVLCKTKSAVRSVDVAEHMGFSKPSVSRGVGLLKADGLIKLDENGFISLTEKGSSLAKKIYERHTILSRALTLLGVDEQTAAEDACRIEHIISDKSFAAIKKYMKNKLK
ncbi:MAG: metal-dependent transcriptional regulator [Clostridia bacterium]|nr:metal-dependent transcriptional regulator [Clostridia bacterium]